MATDTSLVTPAGRLDRRAVMTEAHRQFRLMRRYGWSFGRCLSFAWAKAREQRGGGHGAVNGYKPHNSSALPRLRFPNERDTRPYWRAEKA